jgi:hypothetical protein
MAQSSKIWLDEIKAYDKKFEPFEAVGKKIIDRYRSDNDKIELGSKFNILRSNIGVLKPALYAKPPKPVVSRRFKDKNPSARLASKIIERCLEYEITQFSDYDSALSNSVMDRLLPGRGVAWVRYEPITEQQEVLITEDVESEDTLENAQTNYLAGKEYPLESIKSQTTPCDYVNWRDFAHNSDARTWEEVTWVARKVCIQEKAGIERFGDVFKLLPQAKNSNDKDNKYQEGEPRQSNIWELWHKPSKIVYWLCEGYEHILDEKPDPLNLQDFFPCPKPLYADLTTDSLIPRPDFTLYQDQANELDKVTKKIDDIVQSLEIKGVFAAEETVLSSLLQPGNNAKMFPISSWLTLSEKGGLKGVMDFMPIEPQIQALAQLYEQRDSLIQIIYQLSGISDIQRGASQANETATAQQIKAQFSSIRLGKMKSEVAEFAKCLLRMKAEIIAEKYDPQTLIEVSGIYNLPEVEQNPQIVVEAITLLKNDRLRTFSIEIENDTLVEMDQQAEQQARVEFLSAITLFLEKAVMAGQQAPELTPLIGQMLLFGIRGFKVGQEMESTFESVFDDIENKRKQAAQQPPGPSPEELQMQARGKAQSQSEENKLQMESAKAQAETQLKLTELQAQNEIEVRKLDMERWRVEKEEQTKLMIAKMNHENAIKVAKVSASPQEFDDEGEDMNTQQISMLVETMANNNRQLVDAVMQSNALLAETFAKEINRPKRMVKDEMGNKMSVPVQD